MSKTLPMRALECDGVRYWRAEDVLGFVTELLLDAHTEDQRVIIRHGLQFLMVAAREQIQ